MATTHSDGVPAQTASPDHTPDGAPTSVKHLPAEYYTRFLSDAAKRRGPSPSAPFTIPYLFLY
jgi:tryptophan aminotransferase